MSKLRWLLVLGAILLAITPNISIADDYLLRIREGATDIELGAYDKAAVSIDQALALDDLEPLGHTALGVIYLHTGKLDDAEREFNKATDVKKDEWQAYYALGLINTLRGQSSEASKWFAKAKEWLPGVADTTALEAYAAFLKSGKSPENVDHGALPVLKQTAAMAALKAGDTSQAIQLLTEVLQTPATPGFQENQSPIVTFDAKSPISLPNGKLTWKPTKRKEAAKVKGVVTLRADVERSAGVDHVSFYIDGALASVTNYEPFQFEWNTLDYSNGLHNVRIEGKGQFGDVVSSKTIFVQVENLNARKWMPRSGPEIDELYRRLWNCIRLSESRKLAHYNLAKIYMSRNDNDAALKQLEYVVAYQADFADARHLLNLLRQRSTGYVEISRGPEGSKTIALTFDDGPNERTAELLEVLGKLKVPATFFIVGFRAEAQPQLIKKMVSDGHEIENHTYTHPNLTTLSAEQVESELSKCSGVIRALTGKQSRFFRPPGGHADEVTAKAAAKQGFTGVFWTIGCSPYEGAHYSALADFVLNNACSGAIVLMHNGEPAATSALPRIVKELRARGYRFVTLEEMMSASKPH